MQGIYHKRDTIENSFMINFTTQIKWVTLHCFTQNNAGI